MATDFSQGSVSKNIMSQAFPLILAQVVQMLYNVVDRIYIGHFPGTDGLALTGIGLVFPLTSLIMAFTQLLGMGGTPLFSMARGAGQQERVKLIMGNTLSMLLRCSAVLFVFCYVLRRPILFLFGASEASYVYADAYLKIYLFGTVFSMISVGMNGFINAQGFPGTGMFITITGAALNLVLCNSTLRDFGGDLYVGIMTVINSIREMFTLPVQGLTSGAQPVLGYDYGAYIYQQPGDDPGGGGSSEAVFFGLLLYGLSVQRPVHLCGAGAFQTGGLLLSAAQGNHCGAPDPSAALHRAGGKRGVSCGAHLQSDRRARELHHHVCAGVQEAGVKELSVLIDKDGIQLPVVSVRG